MKKLLVFLMFLAPTMLFAQSAFTGTWRFDVQNGQIGGEPFIQSLQNGVYHCNCVPELTTKRTGKITSAKGRPNPNRSMSARSTTTPSNESARRTARSSPGPKTLPRKMETR